MVSPKAGKPNTLAVPAVTEKVTNSFSNRFDTQAEQMATPQEEPKLKDVNSKRNTVDSQTLVKLSKESFKTFCDDISGMFSVNMGCNQQQIAIETLEGLKKHFKELVAVHCVKAEGALEGTFHLVLDQDGLFTLAGVINMRSEQLILEDIKLGSLEKAKDMSSVLTEVGEALVGAWDRVFRKSSDDHNHLVQTNIFIGNPWSEPDKMNLFSDKELVLVPYQITIDPYPAFRCGVIFPKELFAGTSESELTQNASAGAGIAVQEKANEAG